MTVEDLLNDLSAMGVTPDDYHRCVIYVDDEGGVEAKRSVGRLGVTLCNDHVDSLRRDFFD